MRLKLYIKEEYRKLPKEIGVDTILHFLGTMRCSFLSSGYDEGKGQDYWNIILKDKKIDLEKFNIYPFIDRVEIVEK